MAVNVSTLIDGLDVIQEIDSAKLSEFMGTMPMETLLNNLLMIYMSGYMKKHAESGSINFNDMAIFMEIEFNKLPLLTALNIKPEISVELVDDNNIIILLTVSALTDKDSVNHFERHAQMLLSANPAAMAMHPTVN